jgi:hypothetical protein
MLVDVDVDLPVSIWHPVDDKVEALFVTHWLVLVICQLIAGLRESGLQKGDCVLIHSFNDVRRSHHAVVTSM